ncbi:hypothetical protein OUZ56_032074 [Daphnia magna]|uniref:Uncharacterized protein n=1 Tax=Daphnia magna TaxID=35525 RepID=A0ABQ9ZW28_9CRUS|nr:hypothetical protein OUZ56_032074 [Daphnia magna]
MGAENAKIESAAKSAETGGHHLKGANEAPFNAGTYWGLEKPFDSNIYLEHSCRELKVILEYDHGGYSCCPKCETIGEYAVDDKAGRTQVNPRGRVVYVETDAALRDDESFRSQSDPDHHRGRVETSSPKRELSSSSPLTA